MATMLARSGALPWLAAGVALACAAATGHAAGGDHTAGRWRLGLDAGVGAVDGVPAADDNQAPFLLAFHGHYRLHDRVQVGALLGGYLLQAENLQDPARGAGLSQALLLATARPLPASPATWLEAGAGTVQAWNHAPGARTADGTAWQLAIGHDLWPGAATAARRVSLAPFIATGGGDGNRLSYAAFAAGLRIDWHP